MSTHDVLGEVLSIPIEELTPDPGQPRKTFLKDEIERLAASVAARGILSPLRVRRDEGRQCWIIVTGESRWRAARLAGLTRLPCLAITGEPADTDLLAEQIIENDVRSDLRPLELARAIARLKALKGCTASQLAQELGLKGSKITRALSLLGLPEAVQRMVDDGRVSESAAYQISRLPDAASQIEMAEAVAAGAITRDKAAEAVQDRVGKRNVKARSARLAWKPEGGPAIALSVEDAAELNSLADALSQLARLAREAAKKDMDFTRFARSLKGDAA